MNDPHSDDQSMRTVLRLFPYLQDKTKAQQLKIDEDSIHFISLREHAEQISNMIITHLKKINVDTSNVVVTDATAGVGGNTISFGMKFKHVNAIEIDALRCSYLKNNIDIYNLKNVDIITDDYIKVYNNYCQNVVFIDPPWGGKDYKSKKNLRLDLSGISIETLCNNLLNSSIMKKLPELIVLKLPNNYDVTHFYKELMCKKIYFYDLKKMFILIVVNSNKL